MMLSTGLWIALAVSFAAFVGVCAWGIVDGARANNGGGDGD